MKKEWILKEVPETPLGSLTHMAGISPAITAILINRGIMSPVDADAFLNPSLASMRPPSSIKDIDKAAHRISQAILENQKIQVFGDYDVDGVTGTTLLYNFLTYAGADVCYHIPHRVREGYSFRSPHVKNNLVPNAVKLVVTVDCGSDSHDAVDQALNSGIETVITDHHTVQETLPGAVAVVNPKRPDCTSGLKHLAGVGVVFYLLIELRRQLRDMGFWEKLPEPNLKAACDLVALGTVADIVPLVAENRIFTKAGLEIMNNGVRTGIKALVQSAKLNKPVISSDDIAYKLAPRINAAGRMDHANLAVKLLTSDNSKDAMTTAKSLNRFNADRQVVEQEIFEEIVSYLETRAEASEKTSIVLFRQGWHLGVLGIVAAKLVNRYQKPVILISLEGDNGKGSGRSLPHINLVDALTACSESLDKFGGHSMAAGLSIKAGNLKAFVNSFEDYIAHTTKDTDYIRPVSIDSKISFDDITPDLLDDLERLHPFGCSNEEPLFLAEDITIVSSSVVGTGHRRLILKSDTSRSDKTIMGIHFNVDSSRDYPSHFTHLVFKLQWNRWNNSKSPQIVVEDYL